MSTPLVLLVVSPLLVCVFTGGAAGRQLNRVSQNGVLYAAAPRERGAYAVGTPGGRYNYGYNTGDGIAKVEVRQPDGSVVGSYRYYDPNGKQVIRSYVADNRGFRIMGNDLPISPDTPVSHVAGSPAITGAVEGTEEFVIPPPLESGTRITPQQNAQHQLHYQTQQTQQQEAYRRQHQQLEEQRRQLRVQQEKLATLQRELEAQQQRVNQNYLPIRTVPQYQPVPTPNQLTGGYTSPYYFFQHDFDYDFPAGFAYTGIPTYVDPTKQKTKYPKSTYIIGQAR